MPNTQQSLSQPQQQMITQAVREVTSDPSPLTTQQIMRAVENLKELILARLDAMDKATALFEANLTRVPTEVQKAISHLQDLHDEKFRSVHAKLKERELRRKEGAKNSKLAIDAALQAAEKAVGKSEIATTKQIDEMQRLVSTIKESLESKIEEVRQRNVLIESQIAAILGRSSGASGLWGIIVGAVGVLGGLVALIAFAVSQK